MMSILLNNNEDIKFQDKIIKHIHSDLNNSNLTNDDVIMNLIGISYLDGFFSMPLDLTFTENPNNRFGIIERDTLDELFENNIKFGEPRLVNYYKKAKKYFDNGLDPDDKFLKASPKHDAKMIPLNEADMIKLYKYMAKLIKKSRFTIRDKKLYDTHASKPSVLVDLADLETASNDKYLEN